MKIGAVAERIVNRLRHAADDSGCIPEAAFVRWAMQLLLVSVQWVNAGMMYRQIGLVISHEHDQHASADAGFTVPMLTSWCGLVGGHRWRSNRRCSCGACQCCQHRLAWCTEFHECVCVENGVEGVRSVVLVHSFASTLMQGFLSTHARQARS